MQPTNEPTRLIYRGDNWADAITALKNFLFPVPPIWTADHRFMVVTL